MAALILILEHVLYFLAACSSDCRRPIEDIKQIDFLLNPEGRLLHSKQFDYMSLARTIPHGQSTMR